MMRLCFKQTASTELLYLFTSYFKPNFSETNKVLIINLRKLWVGAYDSSLNGKYSKKNLSVILKIEFLLNEADNYYPLYRFDSSLVIKTANDEILFSTIGHLLIQSTNKIKNVNPGMTKVISYQMLDSFNSSRTKYAANSSQLKKGVYLNFNQFKNNNPAYSEFEIKFGKSTDEIYVKSKKGFDSLITDAWGFSDGDRPFIKMEYNYFPLFQSGNNYDLYGPKDLIIIRPFANPYRPATYSSNYN